MINSDGLYINVISKYTNGQTTRLCIEHTTQYRPTIYSMSNNADIWAVYSQQTINCCFAVTDKTQNLKEALKVIERLGRKYVI